MKKPRGTDFSELKKSWWLEYAVGAFVTGSRIICNPPVEDTDLDVMVLIDEAVVGKFEEELRKHGFRMGGSFSASLRKPLEAWPSTEDLNKKTSNVFHSWKNRDLNLLVTASDEYYGNFLRATCLGAYLNLKRKADRVALFEAVTADKWPSYHIGLK